MKSSHYDVVVIGGGTAGAVAGISAARCGAKTLVVESGSYFGGLSAIGMTWGGFFDNNHKQVIGGIPDELVRKAVKVAGRGYFHYHGETDKWISALASVDAEAARLIMEQELHEAGCDTMIWSTLCDVAEEDGRIQAVDIATRLGRERVEGAFFIDATGDMALAAMLGSGWEHGRDGFTQCVSNMFKVGGIDTDAFEAFLEKHINTDGHDPWVKETGTIRQGIEYWCPWKPDGFERMPKSLGLYFHGNQNEFVFNCTSKSVNALDIRELSKTSYLLRKQAFEVHAYMKENVEGFENSYLDHVYDTGVREGRRLAGDYTVTIDDIVDHTRFADSVGMGAYPPDIHNPDGQVHISSTREYKSASDGAYDIPLRAMTAPGRRNLLVAGRCISATFDAQSAIRGIGPCMVEGQGAGAAAALYVDQGAGDIHDISIDALRASLRESGALLD